MSAAAQCYKATLTVTTGLSAPFNNLAIIYKQQVVSVLWFLSLCQHPPLEICARMRRTNREMVKIFYS